MFQIQRILFPVDLSERSLGAGRYVRAMARHCKAGLTLLHLVEPSTYDTSVVDKIAVRKVELEMFLAAEFRPFQVRRLVLEGDPSYKIVEVAESEGAGLIMMPTHGWGAYRRFILGSVTAKVLHDSVCPVWTCGHAEQAPGADDIHCRTILCALDLRVQSSRVLQFASDLAASHRARLTLVHVCTTDGSGVGLLTGGTANAMTPREAEAQLRSLCGHLNIPDAKTLIAFGEVANAVQRAARETRADLVITGRSTGTMLIGRLRSTAYSIIRQAPCPVISV